MPYLLNISFSLYFCSDVTTLGNCLESPTITALTALDNAKNPVATSVCDASSIIT